MSIFYADKTAVVIHNHEQENKCESKPEVEQKFKNRELGNKDVWEKTAHRYTSHMYTRTWTRVCNEKIKQDGISRQTD